MRSRPKWFFSQSAVVPYRIVGGHSEILLITSRRGKRWTIPKGIVERDLTPTASAAKEAYEEAGVRGEVDGTALGTYEYEKWGGVCSVEVYPMHVTRILSSWPEDRARLRKWLPFHEAVQTVRPASLQEIVRRLARRLDGGAATDH